jgi:hypothetical protein
MSWRVLCAALTVEGLNVIKKAHYLIHNIEEQMTSTIAPEQKSVF